MIDKLLFSCLIVTFITGLISTWGLLFQTIRTLYHKPGPTTTMTAAATVTAPQAMAQDTHKAMTVTTSLLEKTKSDNLALKQELEQLKSELATLDIQLQEQGALEPPTQTDIQPA
jgi:hypothetical protein